MSVAALPNIEIPNVFIFPPVVIFPLALTPPVDQIALELTNPNEPVPVFAITSPLELIFFEAVKLPVKFKSSVKDIPAASPPTD